jgi:GTP-binding protein
VLTDRAKIFVQGGAGGSGAVSFRREAHVPKGGPDGGDGGRGSDVVLVCDDSLRDLQSFRRKAHFKGKRGGHGEGGERHGASPQALEIRVPPGTVVEEVNGGLRLDLTRPGQRAVVAAGGLGGKGNKRFTNSTRQAPRFAEKGLPGEERELVLRLKLLADVGLVGLPNAGKSSLLARMTRAAPKVADYPFTTLEPVLGTLEGPERQLVVADIPGLIEGASGGAGLGHEFLAHVERTRLLVHVLDLAPLDGSDPVANYATVEDELAGYGHGLALLPRIIALSKADLVPAEDAERAASEWRERVESALAVVVTSSATGQGLDELALELFRDVPERSVEAAPAEGEEPMAEHKLYRPADNEGFRVEKGSDGVLRVVGPAVERLMARHDTSNEEALRYIEERLRRLGVIRALEQAGFQPGDDVELAGTVFELDPGAPFH